MPQSLFIYLMAERKKELLKEILTTRFKDDFEFAEVLEDIDNKAAGNIEGYTQALLTGFLKEYVGKKQIEAAIQELEKKGFWAMPEP